MKILYLIVILKQHKNPQNFNTTILKNGQRAMEGLSALPTA